MSVSSRVAKVSLENKYSNHINPSSLQSRNTRQCKGISLRQHLFDGLDDARGADSILLKEFSRLATARELLHC